jgi:hypothetical protein
MGRPGRDHGDVALPRDELFAADPEAQQPAVRWKTTASPVTGFSSLSPGWIIVFLPSRWLRREKGCGPGVSASSPAGGIIRPAEGGSSPSSSGLTYEASDASAA